MKTLEAGHKYLMGRFDDEDTERYTLYEHLQFMKRVGKNYPFNEAPAYGGTNCQEVLRVLIDRVKYLDKQIPCAENKVILHNLRTALYMFESRAAERHNLPAPQLQFQIENYLACAICGHIIPGVCACKRESPDAA